MFSTAVKKFGKATLVDVSNPLKVVLFYKDFATVVMLDRFLNVVNTIDLRKQNIFQARAIAQSYDNKIWVYDELENKLKKIDEDGKLLQETPDFRLLLNRAITPTKIFDENKYVYIIITGWQNFKVTGKFIFGSKADTLYRYDITNFMYDEWTMPEELIKSKAFNFTSSRLYALKKDSVEIYTIR